MFEVTNSTTIVWGPEMWHFGMEIPLQEGEQPKQEQIAPLGEWVIPGWDLNGEWCDIGDDKIFFSGELHYGMKIFLANLFKDNLGVWKLLYQGWDDGRAQVSIAPVWLILDIVEKSGYPMSAHEKVRLLRQDRLKKKDQNV